MKVLRLVLALLVVFPSLSRGDDQSLSDELLGQWQYYKRIYRGVEMPQSPTSTLRLFFEFYPNGTNRLFWYREGERENCERRGEYRIENGHLVDKVVWVNPNNTFQCSKDPDMQLGKESATPMAFADNGDFKLILPLGNETLTYVWKKIVDINK